MKFKSLWCTFIFLTPKKSHTMGFKSRMFGETLILCVLLILDTGNIVNGKLWPSDTEWSVSKCLCVLWQLQMLQGCEQNQFYGGALLFKPSKTLGFKPQLMSRTMWFLIFGNLK